MFRQPAVLAVIGIALFLPLAGIAQTPAKATAEQPAVKAATPMDPAAPNPRVVLVRSDKKISQLETYWSLRTRKLASGDVERATELLEKVQSLRLDTGAVRMDAHAVVLLQEARRAAKAGKHDYAEELALQAELLAPELASISDTQANLALSRSKFALHKWVGFKLKSFGSRLKDFQGRMLLLSDVVLTSLLLIGILMLVFTLSQCIRYGLNLYHDLGEAFPVVMRFVLLAGVFLLILIPMFYGTGPLLIFCPLVILLWPYQRRTERLLTIGFVVFFGITPWLLRVGDRLTRAGTGLTRALHATGINPGDQRALEMVEAAVKQDPDDWQAAGMLGLVYKRLGRLKEAEAILKPALAKASRSVEGAVLANTLGNVYFAQGFASKAEKAYIQAAEMAPNRPEPIFNQHRLAIQLNQKTKAEDLVRKASKMDVPRVSAWTGEDDPGHNRYVVDMLIPDSTWTKRALVDLLAPTEFSERIWVVLAGPVPTLLAPIAMVVTLLALLVLYSMRRKLRLFWPCNRCGHPARVWLADGYPERPTCEECERIFIKSIPVERSVRFAKEESISRYRNFIIWGIRVAGITLPGFWRALQGQAIRGALIAGAALLLGFWIFWPQGVLVDPYLGAPGAFSKWLTVGLLAALWLYSVYGAIQSSRSR